MVTDALTLPGLGAPAGRIYRRPTLEEIRLRPKNGRTAVSTFSGCGGSTLGLKMAGWSVPYAVEFIPAARETYAANHPDAYLDERDVREIAGSEILDRLGVGVGELDLLEGSPPCSSFSMAGVRDAGWGRVKKYSDSEQRTDDLFFEWIRLVEEMRPRAFLAENVPAMLIGATAIEFTEHLFEKMKSLGYAVGWKKLNATWYGVPQARRRLIIVGYRTDLGLGVPQFPSPTTDAPFTVRDALATVEYTDSDRAAIEDAIIPADSLVGRCVAYLRRCRSENREPTFSIEPCQRCGESLYNADYHEPQRESDDGVVLAAICADGKPAVILKQFYNLQIAEWNRPAPTLVAGNVVKGRGTNGLVHPEEFRRFIPSEEMALSGYPADYRLTGTAQRQHERLARSVVPPVYEAVGKMIAGVLNRAR